MCTTITAMNTTPYTRGTLSRQLSWESTRSSYTALLMTCAAPTHGTSLTVQRPTTLAKKKKKQRTSATLFSFSFLFSPCTMIKVSKKKKTSQWKCSLIILVVIKTNKQTNNRTLRLGDPGERKKKKKSQAPRKTSTNHIDTERERERQSTPSRS